MTEFNPDLLAVHLPPTTKSFEADGHTYHVLWNARLSLVRSRWLEKYGFFAMMGRDPRAFITEARRAYDFNNESKPGDVAVTLDNLISSGADMMSREAPMLYICAIFMVRDDEDVKSYDPAFADQKIEAWKKEGIESDFFLQSALSYLKITAEHLSALTVISLGHNLPNLDVLSQSPDLTSNSPSASE